jgi:hypothetical protein
MWSDELQHRVFIDGQSDFHGDATTRQYHQVGELQEGWHEALRARNISTVLIPSSSMLVREPGWATGYRDSAAEFRLRSD